MREGLTLDEIKRVIFNSSIRRSLVITEKPEDIPHHTACRIWDSIQTYAICGTWDGDPSVRKRIEGELP